MELIKVEITNENVKEKVSDKARILHNLRPIEWTVVRSENALKIIQTLRVYMNEGYLEKIPMQQMKLENGEIAVRFK